MAIKVTRPMVIAGIAVCSVAVVVLSSLIVLNWNNPNLRQEAFPLVLLFDLIFAYRLYRYLKMLKDPAKYRIKSLS
jgi:type IV secretory pathway VirB3-like protein